MISRIILIVLVLAGVDAIAQKEKFQINGSGRAYYFANELNIDESLDSITTRKANYGHTLLDLGVSVFPNKNTEVNGTFRIRNELGAFWGGGTTFEVRQLSLKGVAGNVVKYELGDIDVQLTPYTLFNFQEEGVVNESDAFSVRRDIVHYDMFYIDNSWRMQGAKTRFALKFNKLIKEIDVFSFITRQRPAGPTPERAFGGGSLRIRQSDNLTFGFNSVNNFDLTETIADSIRHRNGVHTADVVYRLKSGDSKSVWLKGETGMSSTLYENYSDELAPDAMSDWFYDFSLTGENSDKGLTVQLGYKDVGADFFSPGAQTKRIDYSRFPGLYQQITNDASGRPLSYTDVISGNSENSFQISEELVPYFAAYNNSNPYGDATSNRRGAYLNLDRKDSTGFRTTFLNAAFTQQSRGTGTDNKKNFILVEAGTDVYLNDYLGWKNDFKLDLGVRFENTLRSGEEFEEVDLNSLLIDLGMTCEFAENLDLLFGAKLWTVSGNAFVNERNRFNAIEDFDIVNYDFTENTLAGGLRYRFSENNMLTAQYQVFNIEHQDEDIADYGISQFTILFNMKF
ncbi:MAG: hypothetical protein AB8B53_09665 [Flavobacteriales bacterium]